MAVSGSTDFTLTRDELIYAAFRLLTVIKDDEDPSSWEITNAAQTLNIMMKAWQTKGIGLWLCSFVTIYLEYQKETYNLNGSTGDHATLSSVETALSADIDSGETSITVDSITGITNGDYIGVKLDDGTMQWTTINGVPAGTTIVLTAALTDDASEDAPVYTYTTKLKRPLGFIELRIRDSGDNDVPIEMVARDIMMNLPNKDSLGQANMAYYDPQLTTGVLYVWPTESNVSNRLKGTVKVTIDDVDASTDNLMFPQEWLESLKYNLAVALMPEYLHRMKSKEAANMIRETAADLKQEAMNFDGNNTSVRFIPDLRRQ